MIEWAVGASIFERGDESGDAYVLAPFPGGVLCAVIDGLGHGPEAAIAARAAANVLRSDAHDGLIPLVQRAHARLRKTRGAVLSIAAFRSEPATMTWLGVGNVEGVLLRGDRAVMRGTLITRGGVVGYQLPPLREVSLPVAPGDTLIFVTDGVRGSFASDVQLGHGLQEIADEILRVGEKGTDDALVFVARYNG